MKLVAHRGRVHLPADVDPPALSLVPVLIHPGLVGQVHPIQAELLAVPLHHQIHTVPGTIQIEGHVPVHQDPVAIH